MKGNFHARFGIGGGAGDLSADHTKTNAKSVFNDSRLANKEKKDPLFEIENNVKPSAICKTGSAGFPLGQ